MIVYGGKPWAHTVVLFFILLHRKDVVMWLQKIDKSFLLELELSSYFFVVVWSVLLLLCFLTSPPRTREKSLGLYERTHGSCGPAAPCSLFPYTSREVIINRIIDTRFFRRDSEDEPQPQKPIYNIGGCTWWVPVMRKAKIVDRRKGGRCLRRQFEEPSPAPIQVSQPSNPLLYLIQSCCNHHCFDLKIVIHMALFKARAPSSPNGFPVSDKVFNCRKAGSLSAAFRQSSWRHDRLSDSGLDEEFQEICSRPTHP